MDNNIKLNNIDKWTVKKKEDGYESPIKMIVEDVNIKIENDIVKAVQNYDINVDQEELRKALAYDRDQYNKGFNDEKPVPVKIKRKHGTIEGYYDRTRNLLFVSYIAVELAEQFGWSWEEEEEQHGKL